MQHVIVAGGAGFIGSHLCDRLLADGNFVLCIDNLLTSSEANITHLRTNPHFSFLNHDVTVPLPSSLQADAVFHLASPASPNHHSPISYHKLAMETMMVNSMGTKLLLEFSEKHHARFLFTSTSEIYGDPLEHPQKEQYRGNVSTIGPRSVYDEAKRFGETMVSYFVRDRGVDGRIARLFNTYGPRMNKADMRMSVLFVRQALKGEPITIFGNGAQTRSLCFVDDTVEGIVRLMLEPKARGEVVNLGTQDEHSILEYATLIKELTNSQSEIVFSENLPTDDPLKRRADTTKAKELLGWEPVVSLKEGLSRMISAIQQEEAGT